MTSRPDAATGSRWLRRSGRAAPGGRAGRAAVPVLAGAAAAVLYTFRLDRAAGQAHGNRFTDRFGGVSFDWQAVTTSAGGAPAQPAQSANPSGGYSYQGGSADY
ncbi:MAG: hypothetical protein ACM32E_02520 [Gemmatimonadota bacterium]